MSFTTFFAENFHIIFILVGFAYFLISQKDTPTSIDKKYYWMMFSCSVILLIAVPMELWAAEDLSRYNIRVFMSVIAYWARPAAVMFLVLASLKKSKRRIYIIIPEIINIIIMGMALFVDFPFYYRQDNYGFVRYSWGYTPHVVGLFYAIVLVIVLLIEVTKGFNLESGILFICIIFSTLGLIYTMFTPYEMVSFSIAASGFFNYIFIRAQRHYAEIDQQIKDLEDARYAADKANASKTQFLLNLSHDIRTPMNAIVGFSEIMSKNPEDTEKVKDYTKKIQISGGYLLSLINELLEMSRIESGKIQLVEKPTHIQNITDSISNIFLPQAKDKNITLISEKDITNEYVMCDDTKVFEILFNLLSNSIKYTPEGGKVTVTVKETYKYAPNNTHFQITVKDTGMGISKEFLPHIFEEFSREKSTTESKIAGTGLGMPIVKRLVDLMNGTIDIESEVNVGTSITIDLPIKTISEIIEPEPVKAPQKISVPSDRKVHILLVEDNDLNAEVATTLLEDGGYTVTRVSDGKYCLEVLDEAANKGSVPYDIILMDIQMPILDGHETTKKIRKMGNKKISRLPIIAMTANAFEEDRQKALDAGLDDHISKPIDIEALKNLIDSYTR